MPGEGLIRTLGGGAGETPRHPLPSWRPLMLSSQYTLAPSVRWRTVHGFSIILDVAGDKYLSIPARQFEALWPGLHGGRSSTTTDSDEPPVAIAPLLDELLARRILVSEPTQQAEPSDRHVPKPERLISGAQLRLPLGHALPYAGIFLKSCARADYCIRFKQFSQVISRVDARRRRISAPSCDRLVHLTRVFHALRPFYPRSYLCLFDSLALLEFLAHWELFPAWVFGVTVDPFEAHCWVQQDTIVLCDTWRFQARWCSQIMAI